MPACEHCKHDPETAKAALDQKQAALDIAKRETAKAIGDNAAMHAEQAALAKYKADTEPALAKLTGELGTAAQNMALARRGFVDEPKARGFRGAYSIYAAEQGAAAKPFDAWLDNEAKLDPFTAPHFAAPVDAAKVAADAAAAAKAAAVADPAKKPNPLPGSNAGAVADPGRQGPMSPQQLREFFQSPGFKNLTNEQKKTKRVELETQIQQQRQTPA